MPRVAIEDNSRISVRISAEGKALLLQAVTLQHTDMTNFILEYALRAARDIVAQAERQQLSERDSRRVLDLLENPPHPNARLLAAAQALPPQV